MHTSILGQIINSPAWLLDKETRLVWITLLGTMGDDGISRFGSAANLAHRAGLTFDEARSALYNLADAKPPFIQGCGSGVGWRVLNHDQFVNPIRWSQQQEANRNRMANHRKALAAAAELPFESIRFNDAWCLWEQHRKQKKSPITPNARKLQLAKLAKMGEERAIAALEHSTEMGYTGVFEPKKGLTTGTPATQAELDELEKVMGKCGMHYGAFRDELKRLLYSKPGLTRSDLYRHFEAKFQDSPSTVI